MRATAFRTNKASSKQRDLVFACAYWPSLGGLELTTEKLAFWRTHQGYEVKVLTVTPLSSRLERADFTFEVIRQPRPMQLIAAFRWANLILSKHLSLRCTWPRLVIRRRFLVRHATWYPTNEHPVVRLLRRVLMRCAINVANSRAIADHLERCDAAIHPSYDESIYRETTSWDARSGFVLLGRLAQEKSVDLWLDASAKLPGERLFLIGGGPEHTKLIARAARRSVSDRVHFLGRMEPSDCAEMLNRARVLVVPSRYEEPFGTVALEGLAFGCRVVVSSGGGLPDAAGPTGIVFATGDTDALASAMRKAIETPVSRYECKKKNAHLAENSISAIGRKLMDFF